ncbi:MAG TPA: IS21 family transposase [Polyangia bacterium]
MVEPETVRLMRELFRRGWKVKRIAREVDVARNTVKRYVYGDAAVERQEHAACRRLDEQQRAEAVRLLDGPAAGNAVVVARLLRERGVVASVRTIQRAVAAHRQHQRAAAAATVRFETAPGEQLQIDFGEKRVLVAGVFVKVLFFVAVLSYSRRIFVRAFLAQRQDDWREGLMGAFRQFGGLPKRLLIDNAGALVLGRDAATKKATLHAGFAAFCHDVGVEVSVCQPYRARTKGKTERGVGYVKHNAIAGLEFSSGAALDTHLAAWCIEADERIHGTTHERPRERFERDEKQSLRPLPSTVLPVRERRLKRRVATDCFVDVDTVRYSVPHRLVRRHVEVLVEEEVVRIYVGRDEVACHRRSREPYARIVAPTHLDGLYRRPCAQDSASDDGDASLTVTGRGLADYAAVVEGAR